MRAKTKSKAKTKTKSKISQLVEVRTKVVLGIMLISAYMVTASLAALPFAGINKGTPVNSMITKLKVTESTKGSKSSADDSLARYWESDGGDPYRAGYIVDKSTGEKSAYDYCTDYSNEGDSLVEATLLGNYITSRVVSCDEGCYNGRCVMEYEVCPKQYECINQNSRALINNDCYWSDYEVRDSMEWVCSEGDFYYVGEDGPEEPAELAVCDFNLDGNRDLSDLGIFAQCQDSFDANNDGVHDLIDISLYAQNNDSNSWCLENMTECFTVTSTQR